MTAKTPDIRPYAWPERQRLPVPPDPIGAYERGRVLGGLGMVSGQFPMVGGELTRRGQIGRDLTTVQGREAAQIAATNVVAQIGHMLDHNWDRFIGLLRVDAYLVCSPGFDEAPKVLDAASQTFLELLGEKGRHARMLAIVSAIPMASPLELAASFSAT